MNQTHIAELAREDPASVAADVNLRPIIARPPQPPTNPSPGREGSGFQTDVPCAPLAEERYLGQSQELSRQKIRWDCSYRTM